MAEMTLRELCDSLGVSRRAVQGYEKAGLVSPEGKNERGSFYIVERNYRMDQSFVRNADRAFRMEQRREEWI